MPPQPPIQLLCSTGAFSRESDLSNFRTILTYAPMVPADGFEIIFYSGWYSQLEEIPMELRAAGLRFPAMHAEKSIGSLLGSERAEDRQLAIEKLMANCALATALGCEVLVLHLWGLPESDQHIERNLSALGACVDAAAAQGVALAVETIPCLCADPLAVIAQAMARDPRCLVALDTEFLALHGQLEAALAADWLWDGGRVRHVHIKDYDGQMATADGRRRYLHPGEGHLDFASFFAGLQRRGFRGCVSLEASAVQPDRAVDIARTRRAIATLRELLGQAGAR